MFHEFGVPIIVTVALIIVLRLVRGRSRVLRLLTWTVAVVVGIVYLLPRVVFLAMLLFAILFVVYALPFVVLGAQSFGPPIDRDWKPF